VSVHGLSIGKTVIEVNERTETATMDAGHLSVTRSIEDLVSGAAVSGRRGAITLSCYGTLTESADDNGRDAQGRQGVLQ
jgi:hypothetical protein